MHVVRDMGKADDGQLAAIQERATQLLGDLEQFMGGDLVEALCLWRQSAKRQQDHRAARAKAGAAVTPLRPAKAG